MRQKSCGTYILAYCDTLGTREKCHCKQIFAYSSSFWWHGICQNCHCKQGNTITGVTVTEYVCGCGSINSIHHFPRRRRGLRCSPAARCPRRRRRVRPWRSHYWRRRWQRSWTRVSLSLPLTLQFASIFLMYFNLMLDTTQQCKIISKRMHESYLLAASGCPAWQVVWNLRGKQRGHRGWIYATT